MARWEGLYPDFTAEFGDESSDGDSPFSSRPTTPHASHAPTSAALDAGPSWAHTRGGSMKDLGLDKGKGRAEGQAGAAAHAGQPDIQRPAPPARAAPPSLLPLPGASVEAAPTALPPPPTPLPSALETTTARIPPVTTTRASTPISLSSSPILQPKGPSTSAKAKGKAKANTSSAVQVDLTADSDEETPEIGRKYMYPLPPDLDQLPLRGGEDWSTSHAGDAAFWAVYGNMDSYNDWVRRVARENPTPPPLPPQMGTLGHEMAWAHAAIYSRHVQDAKRVVSAQELASQTDRNLQRIRDLQERVRHLQGQISKDTSRPSGPLGVAGALGSRPGPSRQSSSNAPLDGPLSSRAARPIRQGASAHVALKSLGTTSAGPSGASGSTSSRPSRSGEASGSHAKPGPSLRSQMEAVNERHRAEVERQRRLSGPAGTGGAAGSRAATSQACVAESSVSAPLRLRRSMPNGPTEDIRKIKCRRDGGKQDGPEGKKKARR